MLPVVRLFRISLSSAKKPEPDIDTKDFAVFESIVVSDVSNLVFFALVGFGDFCFPNPDQ